MQTDSNEILLAIELSNLAAKKKWRWFSRKVSQWCKSLMLPPRISLALDASGCTDCETAILHWAVDQAINRWNRVVDGLTSFVKVNHTDAPDLLIQPVRGLVAGNSMGIYFSVSKFVFSVSKFVRFKQTKARTVIYVTIATSRENDALLTSPYELRCIIEHELGHHLRLADSESRSSIMGRTEWGAQQPWPGREEREMIITQTRKLHECIVQLTEKMGGKGTLTDSIQSRSLSSTRRSEFAAFTEDWRAANFPLSPEQQWMRLIWEGERSLRRGDIEEALEYFANARRNSPSPWEAELRIALTDIMYAGEVASGTERLTKIIPHFRPSSDITCFSWLYGVLASAYTLLQNDQAARWCQAQEKYYSVIERIQGDWWFVRHGGFAGIVLFAWNLAPNAFKLLYWRYKRAGIPRLTA
jgi:hypothetical protein